MCTGQEIHGSICFAEFDNLVYQMQGDTPLTGEDITRIEQDYAILARNFNVYTNYESRLPCLFKFVSDVVATDLWEINDLTSAGRCVSFMYKNRWKIGVGNLTANHIRIDSNTDTLVTWQHTRDYSIKREYNLKDHVYIPLLAHSNLPVELCVLILKYI